MKKSLFAIETLCLLFMFALPAVFADEIPSGTELTFSFNFNSLIQLLWSLVLVFTGKEYFIELYKPAAEKSSSVYYKHSICIITFGCLVLISVVFEGIYMFLEAMGGNVIKVYPLLPQTPLAWISALLAIFSSAFFEETVYRFAFCDAGRILFNEKVRYIFEAAAILIFASGHRYLGIPGVLNALCSGIVLRLSLIKSGQLHYNVLIHFIYNLSVFILAGVL